MEADSQTDVPRLAAPPPTLSVFDELSKVFAFARETLSDFLELVSLEARRAALALIGMIVGGLVAAIFIVTAWAGLMTALAMYVVSLGMLPIAAVVVVAGVNLIAGAGMLYWCINLSRRLLFAATQRQLAGIPRADTSDMTQAPILTTVNATELRLIQSKRNVRQSVDRTRSALRTTIKRPSTLVLVAVASGISAYWVSRNFRPSVESLPDNADAATNTFSRGLVRTLISLYGAQILASVLQHGAAAWKHRGAPSTPP